MEQNKVKKAVQNSMSYILGKSKFKNKPTFFSFKTSYKVVSILFERR